MSARVDLHTAATSTLLYASSLDPLPRSQLPSLPRSLEHQPQSLTTLATSATIGSLMSSIIRLRETGDGGEPSLMSRESLQCIHPL